MSLITDRMKFSSLSAAAGSRLAKVNCPSKLFKKSGSPVPSDSRTSPRRRPNRVPALAQEEARGANRIKSVRESQQVWSLNSHGPAAAWVRSSTETRRCTLFFTKRTQFARPAADLARLNRRVAAPGEHRTADLSRRCRPRCPHDVVDAGCSRSSHAVEISAFGDLPCAMLRRVHGTGCVAGAPSPCGAIKLRGTRSMSPTPMASRMPTAARPPLKLPVRSLIAPTIIGL